MTKTPPNYALEPLPHTPEDRIALRAESLTKSYPSINNRPPVELFHNLNLRVLVGEMVAIVGESGVGKSSLLHLLAALDRPTAGKVFCGPTDVGLLSPSDAADFRNKDIGYVWQSHYLLPEFSAEENIALPLLARNTPRTEALTRARQWLAEVGLADRAQHRPGELSGGEQQRVSLARALVTGPRILLADEPTGDLDASTAESVFTLIQHLHQQHRLTSILVTHSLTLAAQCTRTLRLSNGTLQPA